MNTDRDNTPKKYIRTFAGDMAILQKGGQPELAPLAGSKPSLPGSPSELPPKPSASPIETYASDFSDRMKEVSAAPATVLAAEQDAAPRPRRSASAPAARSSILYISAGIVLLITSAFVAYFAYSWYTSSSSEPVILAPTVSAPIAFDETEQISGTGAVLLQAIGQSVAKPIGSGAIRLLSAADASATTSVFASLQLPAPDILLRNVKYSGSMAGIVAVDGAQSPFFILSVTSYSDTFSGMLSWERTMPGDLGILFPAYPVPVVGTSTATSTVASTPLGFRDETVSNHDVRVYRDIQSRSIVLYGYWNQTTLIIARDPAAFSTILERLATSVAPQ